MVEGQMKDKIAVVGFSKCGTMSLVEWLKKKHPNAEVSRPETIYADLRGPHVQEKWIEWSCVVITRNPLDRIKSGISYWPELRNKGIEGACTGIDRYFNVGFGNPIEQSNYEKYIKLWQRRTGTKIEKVYKFEDMIKDTEFPHINETPTKIKFSKKEIDHIKNRLQEAGISY